MDKIDKLKLEIAEVAEISANKPQNTITLVKKLKKITKDLKNIFNNLTTWQWRKYPQLISDVQETAHLNIQNLEISIGALSLSYDKDVCANIINTINSLIKPLENIAKVPAKDRKKIIN